VSKNSDIDARIAKIERLTQRIGELQKKWGVKSHDRDDKWGEGGLTKKEHQELAQKQGELEQLIKEDEKAVGL